MPSISPSPAVRQHAEDLICRTGLYRPVRNAYQRMANRPYFADRRAARQFLSQFVRRGDLVFDVGANHGRYSELCLDLGARVVSIEPNPRLAERIRARYGASGILVEAAAVGRTAGAGELHLGLDDIYSTMSSDWVDTVRSAESLPDRWEGTVEVPITTLDELIRHHGCPEFVKIDVEGFERDVLGGLTSPIPALSFEYQCPDLSIARDCVDMLTELGRYEYSYSGGEEFGLRAPWAGPEALFERLETVREREFKAHGDVYVRAGSG
jgi:FkbM family methyltransferase